MDNNLQINNINFRKPFISDSAQATIYINTISTEDTFITFSGEQLTVDEERSYIMDCLSKIERGDMVKLYAELDGKIVAEGSVERDFRTKKRGLHRAMIGLTVAKEFRGQGIGRALMQKLIDETKINMPDIRIIYLTVFGQNSKAISLYKSLGFVEFGRLPEGLLHKGHYDDYVFMFLNI
ncbi:MAG: GNAT family N-acetyltransferase [Patescibacteria group bacterium]